MSNKNNSLVKKFFEFALGNGIVILLSIATIPIASRLVDNPIESGGADMFLTYTGLIVLLATMGLDQAFIRFYNDEKSESKGSLLRKSVFYPIIIALIVSILSLVFYKFSSYLMVKENNFIVVVLFVINVLASIISNFALINIRMKQKAKTYSLVSASNKIAYLVALVVVYKSLGNSYLTLMYTICISNVVMLIFALITGRDEWFKKGEEAQTSVETLRNYGLPFIFSMGLTWIFQSADRLSISYLISDKNQAKYEVGIYGGAMKIVAILNTIQGIFTTFWVPVAYERYAKNPEDTKFFSKISELVSFFMLCFAVGLMAFKDVVIMFLHKNYAEAKFIFPFLVMMPIMYTISETTFLGINFKKQTKKHVSISAVAAIANVIGNFILVPFLGAKGAAISTGIAYVIFFTIRTYYGNKYYSFYINYKSLVPSVIIVYGFAILSSIYSFNLYMLAASIVTFILIFVLYRKLIIEMIGTLKNRLLKKS